MTAHDLHSRLWRAHHHNQIIIIQKEPAHEISQAPMTIILIGFFFSSLPFPSRSMLTSMKQEPHCLNPTRKVSFLRAKRATLISKKTPFIVTSSVTFETFGDSFLPLENSFRFFQIILHCKYPESERIWKNLQGAKTIHQRFFGN